MRDPNRLYPVYNEITRIHMNKFPDWRCGQLLINFMAWMNQRSIDLYYLEENDMLFREFAGIDTENTEEEG